MPAASRGAVSARPKIYYLDPLRTDTPADLTRPLAHAAALGFDTVPHATDFRAGTGTRDRFAPASLGQVHPRPGGRTGRGLRPAPCGSLRRRRPASDARPGDRPARGGFHRRRLYLRAAFGWQHARPAAGSGTRARTLLDADAAGPWWGGHVQGWGQAGLAGLRILGLQAAPGALPGLASAAPGLTLIAWTPGLAASALGQLTGADYVVSSMPWWDGRPPGSGTSWTAEGDRPRPARTGSPVRPTACRHRA